jgi:hypothetical protein
MTMCMHVFLIARVASIRRFVCLQHSYALIYYNCAAFNHGSGGMSELIAGQVGGSTGCPACYAEDTRYMDTAVRL